MLPAWRRSDKLLCEHWRRKTLAPLGKLLILVDCDGIEEWEVPSLIRFLIAVGFVAGTVYGVMFALATFVDPQPREISVRVPTDQLRPQ